MFASSSGAKRILFLLVIFFVFYLPAAAFYYRIHFSLRTPVLGAIVSAALNVLIFSLSTYMYINLTGMFLRMNPFSARGFLDFLLGFAQVFTVPLIFYLLLERYPVDPVSLTHLSITALGTSIRYEIVFHEMIHRSFEVEFSSVKKASILSILLFSLAFWLEYGRVFSMVLAVMIAASALIVFKKKSAWRSAGTLFAFFLSFALGQIAFVISILTMMTMAISLLLGRRRKHGE